MRSDHKHGEMNWVMKQFIEELRNKWSDSTYGMVLAIAEEKMKMRREEFETHGGFVFTAGSNES